MDNYINASEAAKILNIHKESIRRLARQGKIRAEKFCGVYYFDADYVEQYANSYIPLPGNKLGAKLGGGKGTRAKRTKSGYVYILLAENGLRKIGQTSDPNVRLKGAFTMSPIEIEIEKVYKVKDARFSEKKLHQMFSSKRVRGEWFNLDESDVKSIGGMLEEVQFTIKKLEEENGLQLPLFDFLR